METAFRTIKHSALANWRRSIPRCTPSASVRYSRRTCSLWFSKLACEIFDYRTRALIEYNDQNRTLRFTVYAADAIPRGLDERDCFNLRYVGGKSGAARSGLLSLRRLLRHLGRDPLTMASGQWKLVEVDAERHSIALQVPAADQAETGEVQESGHNSDSVDAEVQVAYGTR
jgi:hypothetical protein